MSQSLKALKGVAVEVFEAIGERDLGLVAAGVAFYAMLAVFPAIAAVIAIWGVVSDPTMIAQQLEMMQRFIPPDAFDILDEQVVALSRAEGETLGWATAISTGAALWSARSGVAALMRGLNRIYQVANRSGVRQAATALMLTGVLVLSSLVAMASILVVPVVLAFFPLGPLAEIVVATVRWGAAVAAVLFALGLVYRYGPNRRGERSGWFTPGAVLAVTIWIAASAAFSFYLANFGSYNEVYGSIGAVIALLMWLYISAYVVLLGAVVNTVIESPAPRVAGRAQAPDGAAAAAVSGPPY